MYDCLFDDGNSRRLRNLLYIYQRRYDNALRLLQTSQRHNSKRFAKEPGRPNLLAFLYWCKNRRQQAKELNESILLQYPENVAALAAAAILADGGDTAAVVTESESKSECDLMACEGELAYALRFLGPPFYREAISRYDKLAARYNELDDGEQWLLEKDMSSWCFYRAQTYNRIIYPGFFRTFGDKGLTLDGVFEKIAESLRFPIYVYQGKDVEFKGRAMVELVDVHSKCRVHGVTVQLTGVENPEQLLREALVTSPQDPYVLKKCGQLYMLRAAEKNPDDDYGQLMRQAIEVYEKYEGPLKSVIQFHRGRAFHSLSCHIRKNGLGAAEKFQCSVLLRMAKSSFEEAMNLDGNSCKTLTELAWTCNFLRQYGDAENWFTNAAQQLINQKDTKCDRHAPLLYIRWAGFRSYRRTENSNLDVNRDVLPLYREAVRWMLTWRKKEFHRKNTLKLFIESLRHAITQVGDNNVLLMERVLWIPIVNQYYDHAHPIIDILKQNSESTKIVRDLVDLLVNDRDNFIPEQASAAFLYLTVLFVCELLKVNDKDDRLFAVDVAKKIFNGLQKSRSEDAVNLVARDTYCWLIGRTTISSTGFPSTGSSQELAASFTENDVIDVCVLKLGELQSEPTLAAVDAMLGNHLGLHVVSADMSTSPDMADIVEMVIRSKSLMILDDGVPSTSSNPLLNEAILDLIPASVVVVRVVGDEYPAEDVHGAQRWPRLVANCCQSSPSDLAFVLLDTISRWSFWRSQQLENIDD